MTISLRSALCTRKADSRESRRGKTGSLVLSVGKCEVSRCYCGYRGIYVVYRVVKCKNVRDMFKL